MAESFVNLRVVYEDLPDQIELAINMRHGGWSADANVYVPPALLTVDAPLLCAWTRSPGVPFRFGSEVPYGGFSMESRIMDAALHVSCRFQLTTRERSRNPSWQVAIDLPTELGLVERFAQECVELGRSLPGTARLVALLP